jgi:hypothetical protein
MAVSTGWSGAAHDQPRRSTGVGLQEAGEEALYGRTKPGTLLKHQIPIKAERWETTEPGFGEIDLVSHSGDRADGEFVNSLTFTDIYSTWTETRAVMGKSQAFVQEALEDIRNKLPFPMRGSTPTTAPSSSTIT